MHTSSWTLAAITLAAAAVAPAALADEGDATTSSHGKIAWFEGSWDELLAAARESEKVVFIDFWTDWCGWCKVLDKETFSDDAVAAEMRSLLCYSVDAESEEGAPIAERFGVESYPSLVFLSPDGSPRDKILGYVPPEPFLEEVGRIVRNEGTLPALRARIAASGDDLGARWELAQKLRDDWGDREGYDEQVAAIRELDPEGESLAMRSIRLDELAERAQETGDLEDLYAFLETEDDPELRTSGWFVAYRVETMRLRTALEQGSETLEDARADWLAASKGVLEALPAPYRPSYQNQIAWTVYEDHEGFGPETLAWAIEIARDAAAAVEGTRNEANLLDTLACCLFASGEHDEAIALLKRAVELDPENETFRARLNELSQVE